MRRQSPLGVVNYSRTKVLRKDGIWCAEKMSVSGVSTLIALESAIVRRLNVEFVKMVGIILFCIDTTIIMGISTRISTMAEMVEISIRIKIMKEMEKTITIKTAIKVNRIIIKVNRTIIKVNRITIKYKVSHSNGRFLFNT